MPADTVEVAVGVIEDAQGRVLVARRPDDVHQGGQWEFPGGKRQLDEPIHAALYRELYEELGVEVQRPSPLITLRYRYPEKTVVLYTWRIRDWRGRPRGREGQPVEWRSIEALQPSDFPAANCGIIRALQLPEQCLITPDLTGTFEAFLNRLEHRLSGGIGLVILRSHRLPSSQYLQLADRVISRCRVHGARCMLNIPPEWLTQIDCDGIHLTASRVPAFRSVAAGFAGWVSAACHSIEELTRAQDAGADFVTVSPVQPTPTHPNAATLGWKGFEAITAEARIPVYALGGMSPAHLGRVRAYGGHGVAGIRGFWL